MHDRVDLYAADPTPSKEIALGQHAFAAGTHSLQVKIVGANPQAEKVYMFGIDYLRLEKMGGESP